MDDKAFESGNVPLVILFVLLEVLFYSEGIGLGGVPRIALRHFKDEQSVVVVAYQVFHSRVVGFMLFQYLVEHLVFCQFAARLVNALLHGAVERQFLQALFV